LSNEFKNLIHQINITMIKIKIYCGLSINAEAVKKILPQALISPPIKRDDLLRDVDEQIDIVGIIDGEFYNVLAVTPAEILDAQRSGIKIYGSSSMGALRAVECGCFGMIGIGKIYQHILESEYFRDDFLSTAFSTTTSRIPSSFLSVPYIDFYYVVQNLLANDLLKTETAQTLLSIYGNFYFPNRTRENLVEFIHSNKHSESIEALEKSVELLFSDSHFFSQKKQDALLLLETIKYDFEQCLKNNELLHQLQSGQWISSGMIDLWK
jgi:hypothetical protein